ncbi:MAG: hypothetical protein WD876_00820 [Candidatus Pacearchaeota archaeon]
MGDIINNIELFLNLKDSPIEFFNDALLSLGKELNFYCELEEPQDTFGYNERALLGFFINGLVRRENKRFITIQEYVVNNNAGRADLLVYDTLFDCYFLIEAKQQHRYLHSEEFFNGLNNHSQRVLSEKIEKQCRIYYEAEPDFYRNKKTFLCALYFEVVSKNKDNHFAEEFSSKKVKQNLENIFYTVYYSSDPKCHHGLAVYGMAIKA